MHNGNQLQNVENENDSVLETSMNYNNTWRKLEDTEENVIIEIYCIVLPNRYNYSVVYCFYEILRVIYLF